MNQSHIADFSRQMKVPGMGAAAQAKLAHARVLVFGAGGLGATALPYLAAAGVGTLTIVDHDHISASNLHRQIPFTYDDIGAAKAERAAAFCRARMPAGSVCAAINQRLSGDALLDAVVAHDVVLDCSDSRSLAYQLNDAALIGGKPVVFANAAALGGQLFTLHPEDDEPCWRCLWPEAVLPGGNCDALGVLGPVPGVFGLYQALEALKILTGFAPPLHGEVLHYDFTTMRQWRLKIARRAECDHHPHRDALQEIPCFHGTLAAALAQGLTLIDIRNADECEMRPFPYPARRIPMTQLLAQPDAYLAPTESAVLVCASGQRAQQSAKALRAQGYRQIRAYPDAW